MPRIGKYWLFLDLYYTPDHTWMRVRRDGPVELGIDDFAQRMAGRILRIRLAKPEKQVEQFRAAGTWETSKWVGKISSPVSGRVVAVNEEVVKNPGLVNEDPYGKGWLLTMEPSNLEEELNKLITGDAAIEWLKAEIAKHAKEEA